MADSAFTNDTVATATELGTLAFSGNSFEGPTTSRIFDFDSTGWVTADPEDTFTTDLGDIFTFDPYLLSTVEITFNADSVGDFANTVFFYPLAGVSAVTGDAVAIWTGGIHNALSEGGGTVYTNLVNGQADQALTALQGGFVPGTSFLFATKGVNDFAGSTATWTLTGEPVVFQVFGIEWIASESQVENNDDIDPQEVSYNFTIEPGIGLPEPDDPPADPGPAPAPPSNPAPPPVSDPEPEPEPEPVYIVNDIERSEVHIGTAARDTFNAVGPSEDFTFEVLEDGTIRMIDSLFPEAPDILSGIERVEFWDGFLAFDTDGNAGQAYRIYQAAFGRDPDAEGLGFWIDNYDDGNVDLVQMADYFMQSAEFEQLYGNPNSLSDFDFLTLLYANVLDRTPDGPGFEFWTEQQQNGLARAEILAYFSESVENYENVAAEIADGIWYV